MIMTRKTTTASILKSTASTIPHRLRRTSRFSIIAVLFALFMIAGPAILSVGAQDFGFGAADSPATDSATGGAAAPAVASGGFSMNGTAEFRLRGYVDTADPAATALEARPSGRLDFSWTSTSAEAKLNLKLDPASLIANPASLLDEAWLATFAGAFEIKAGLFRTTWGKGDSLHVLDVLDPTDYTDFVNSDPKYSKLAQPTIKVDVRTTENGKLELAYLPVFRGNAIPVSGRWMPASLNVLKATLASPYYGVTPPVSLSEVFVYPGTDTLRWGQAGARLTDSLGGIDVGLQYYYGFLREPVIDMNPANFAMNDKKIHVDYDRYHQIGADAAFVLAGFNFRAEAAFNMTGDVAGDNYLVHNRSVGWTAGVDRDIFGFGVNLQTQGNWILNHDKIALSPFDIETKTSELTNLLVLRLSRSFFNEKLALEATGVWLVGSEELMVKPKVSYTFPGDVVISAEGSWFDGAASGQFGQYKADKYVELAFSLPF